MTARILTCLENPLAGMHQWLQTGTRRAGNRSLPVYVCGRCHRQK